MVTSISVALQGFPRLAVCFICGGERAGQKGGSSRTPLDGPLLPKHPQKPVVDGAKDTSHIDVVKRRVLKDESEKKR